MERRHRSDDPAYKYIDAEQRLEMRRRQNAVPFNVKLAAVAAGIAALGLLLLLAPEETPLYVYIFVQIMVAQGVTQFYRYWRKSRFQRPSNQQ